MKKILLFAFVCSVTALNAQTPFQRVYSVLNTKCQNGTCHSASSSEALKFDGDENAVYAAIFNVDPQNASSLAKHEKLVKQGHPYMSFLLRKIAGANFDTDLAIDASEGQLMKDINGNALSNKEIEFMRQWIMYSALKTYPSNEPSITTPDWQVVSDYYDNPVNQFLTKPARPAANTGAQFRMGPVFLPVTGSSIEQEYMLQQEVNFPYLAEVNKIEGFMNQQSHHFLLFAFDDSAAAVDRCNCNTGFGMQKVAMQYANTSFDGNKVITSAWQSDEEMVLPEGTGFFWPRKTYFDMNFHVKNYNATAVLPCDFYFNIYYKPRDPNTIEMKSNLINNALLGIIPPYILPGQTTTVSYADGDNNSSVPYWKYVWMLAGHTHQWGTGFDIYVKDSSGTDTKVYDGFYDYKLNYDRGYWDHVHPPIAYWDELMPVKFGKQNGNKMGLVSKATYNDTSANPIAFSFQTNGEMQLFYYMYTDQPLNSISTAINETNAKPFFIQVVPNPMSQTGKLVYSLQKDAVVSATIVDITGKTIASLSQEREQEGLHEITIGNNDNLAKGMYVAKISVDGVVYTKKFVVTE